MDHLIHADDDTILAEEIYEDTPVLKDEDTMYPAEEIYEETPVLQVRNIFTDTSCFLYILHHMH
jgi:hypothetical protein